MKIDLYPTMAQYMKNQPVTLTISIEDNSIEQLQGDLYLYHLNICLMKKHVVLTCGYNYVDIGSFDNDFGGYGVELQLVPDLLPVSITTSFDVVNNPGDTFRYGFLSDFDTDDYNNDDIENMKKFHINFIQFYDWSYRHDHLVSDKEKYLDMMGKPIDKSVVKGKIDAASKNGMRCLAYGAIYASSLDFYKEHSDWALYNGANEVIKFIDTFYIMNIEKECPWHDHIVLQYKTAVSELGFCGIHMDTYGFPKTAYSHYKNTQKKVFLENHFCELIDDTVNELKKIRKDTYSVFNNVGNWPVTTVGNSLQSAMYIEVWSPNERYFHLKQIIIDAKNASYHKKPVILAAYLKPFQTEDSKEALFCALLATAMIVSNGAYHLLLGEKNAILTQGYYVDYSTLTEEQSICIRQYYDFQVRYMEFFYCHDSIDVSMTHIGWDNYEYICEGVQWSSYAQAGKVNLVLRENASYKTISMINLCGVLNDLWNEAKEKPIEQENISFKVFVDQKIKGVYLASPDMYGGKSMPVPFEYFNTDKGIFIKFNIKSLILWNLIYIEI